MSVSENNGTPKSSFLIGFSIINHPFWGTPIFWNTHMATQCEYIVETLHMRPHWILLSSKRELDRRLEPENFELTSSANDVGRFHVSSKMGFRIQKFLVEVLVTLLSIRRDVILKPHKKKRGTEDKNGWFVVGMFERFDNQSHLLFKTHETYETVLVGGLKIDHWFD